MADAPHLPLQDIKVLDIATLFAGPSAATILGDFGAEVTKIEHPRQPDAARTHGASKDGVGLWWVGLGRNKRTMTLDLHHEEGQRIFLELVKSHDVVVENFRPGTLERWNLGYDRLSEVNPGLILTRVTGYGQVGPRSTEPAFGTIAEAMSGFAFGNGFPDRPPSLPPLALADYVTGMAAVIATLTALHERERTGRGQIADLAIIESLVAVNGAGVTLYDQLGVVNERKGNRTESNAPRGIYQTKDGDWVALAGSSTSTASRILTIVGRADMTEEPWFSDGRQRAVHGNEIDSAIAEWIGARPTAEVMQTFHDAQAPIGPVHSMAGIFADEQYAALETIKTVEDPVLGPVRVSNVLFRLSETPGAIRFTGRPHGADTAEILEGLGIGPDEQERLAELGIV